MPSQYLYGSGSTTIYLELTHLGCTIPPSYSHSLPTYDRTLTHSSSNLKSHSHHTDAASTLANLVFYTWDRLRHLGLYHHL
jgi:hypothetical protein